MAPGDKILVSIPYVIPDPYHVFSPHWLSWIRLIQGTEVVLIEEHEMAVSDHPDIAGWNVAAETIGECSNWLPSVWLENKNIFSGFCNACGGFHRHRLGCPL